MSVELDWSEVEAGTRQLADGIERGARRVARDLATEMADAIRTRVPVRTGALVGTVEVVDDPAGASVSYGGNLRYAWFVEHRSHAVALGTADAAERFRKAEQDMADEEVRKL